MTIYGGVTPSKNNERVSIPYSFPSSFGGDVDSLTPKEGGGSSREDYMDKGMRKMGIERKEASTTLLYLSPLRSRALMRSK